MRFDQIEQLLDKVIEKKLEKPFVNVLQKINVLNLKLYFFPH